MTNKKILSFLALFTFILNLLFSSFSYAASANTTLSCAGVSVNIKKHSGSLIMTNDLKLSEPQIVKMDTNAGCAVVVWNTSALSTSQVVFAKKGEQRKIDLINKDEKTFWGYPRGSVQNNAAEVYHVMIINGLEKGKKYYLRAVSRPTESALPFLSKEIEFFFDKAKESQLKVNSSSPVKTVSAQIQTPISTNSYGSKAYNTKLLKEFQNKTYKTQSHDFEKFPTKEEAKKEKLERIINLKKEDITEQVKKEAASEEALSTEETKVVEAVGAANAAESLRPLWERIKSWFSSLFGSKEYEQSPGEESSTLQKRGASKNANTGTSTPELNDEEESDKNKESISSTSAGVVKSDAKALLQEQETDEPESDNSSFGLGFLLVVLPAAVIIALLYFVQNVANKFFNIKEKQIAYWMTSFAVLSAVFAVLKNIPLTLMFIGLFLLTLAWYLFKIAMEDIDEEEKENEGYVEVVSNKEEEVSDS